MAVMSTTALSILVAVSCIAGSTSAAATASSSSSSNSIEQLPSIQAAREQAYAVFNSIHSAMRQFGSSNHHNGLSFYLAQAPEGSEFYHGTRTPNRPQGPEWLGFEIEHSAVFALSWEPVPEDEVPQDSQDKTSSMSSRNDALFLHLKSHGSSAVKTESGYQQDIQSSPPTQQPLGDRVFHTEKAFCDGQGDDSSIIPKFDKYERGYFQTYRANRPLNLLYIDGEGAAKSPIGTLDSQDHILLGWDTTICHDHQTELRRDYERAQGLCALAEEWAFEAEGGKQGKLDGFIRMEAGFEIIYCDFSPAGGLDLVSKQAMPFQNETGLHEETHNFLETRYVFAMEQEWLRAVASRFHGHPAGRLDIDWSSMVSAFAYPLNLSNPNPDRPDLPRLLNATKQDRQNVRARLRDVVIERGGQTATRKRMVNWQSVVDKIVTRYSDRLWMLANTAMPVDDYRGLIASLTDIFTGYLNLDPLLTADNSPIDRCTQEYLNAELLRRDSWTPEDEAIAAAIQTVSQRICTSLFTARDVLRANKTVTVSGTGQSPLEDTQNSMRRVLADLKWSTWKECGGCPIGTICSIPLYPAGTMDDYLHPSCKDIKDLMIYQDYWD